MGQFAGALKDFQSQRTRLDPGVAFSGANRREVQRTLDADTLEGTSEGSKLVRSVRFAGIDAPEAAQGSIGPQAQAWLDSQLKDVKDIRLGSKSSDMHGRDVSTVYADGRNLNVELVRSGNAKVYDRYLNTLSKPIQKALLNAQEEAKEAGRGVWASGNEMEDPEAFRRSQEAKYGSHAGGMGHDRRARLDPTMMTVGEALRNFRAERNPGKNQTSMIDSYAGGKSPKKGDFTQGGKDDGGGLLDDILRGLDYAGNASRSTLKGFTEDGGGIGRGLSYGAQALQNRRSTSASQLKDTLTNRVGLGKVRFGRDDGKFQMGDVLDFAGDLSIDIVTDPLTWATFGAGRLLKGGGALAQGARDLKLGLDTVDAAKFATAHRASRAALGGIYGYGAVDKNGDALDHLAGAAIGVGLGLAAGPGIEKAGKLIRDKGFDPLTNWYASKTRGSSFGDFANQFSIAKGSYDKRRNIAEWIRQGRLKALEDLDPAQRLETTQVMQALKTKTLERRQAYESGLEGLKGEALDIKRNEIMARVNKEVEEHDLPQILAGKAEQIGTSVRRWGEHNEKVIEKLNKEAFGLADRVADKATGKGLIPMRFHVDDVYKLEDLKKAEGGLLNLQIHRAQSLARSGAAKEIGPDKSYAFYAENFSKKFLDDAERQALDLVTKYKEAPIIGGNAVANYAKFAEPKLKKIDGLTNLIKANMLYFSTSWLKNNYFDNVAKAYVENGLSGLIDTATTGAFRKGVAGDVMNLFKGNTSKVYKSEYFQDALHYGALDNPMFKAMADDMTRDFMFRPQEILDANEATLANYFNKAKDIWFAKNPVIALVSRTGSYMEGTARFTTYINTYEALKSSKAMKGVDDRVLKEMAAKVVKDSFFDYGDVSAMENAVLKRLIPFYSFYAKNFPYWIQATFDPARAGRVVAAEKIRQNIGREPTKYDREGMTPFLSENAPRKLGKDKQGNQEFLIVPSSSAHEAFHMLDVSPKHIMDELIEKGATLPKGIIELATGKDLFTDDRLYPGQGSALSALSETDPQGKKFLFSRGFKWYAAKKGLETLGFEPDGIFQKLAGTAGVEVDKRGNPYTKEGWTVVLDKVISTIFPHGFVDQVASNVGKGAYNKQNLTEAIQNLTLPMQKVKVSPDFSRMVRVRKSKEKKEDGK